MSDSTYSRFSQTLLRLKGLAILMVVTFHLWGYTRGYFNWSEIVGQAQRQGMKGWIEAVANLTCLLGEQGVHFFLIASGFGLAASWWRQNQAGKPFRAMTFWRRRVTRLLPLYWLAHGLAIVLFLLNPAWVPFGGELWNQGTASVLLAMFASLTTLRNFLIHTYSFLNGAWWYVGLSIQLYLVFPLLIWIGRRWDWSVLLIGSLGVSLAYRSLVIFSNLESRASELLLKGAFFPSRLFEFAFGIFLAIKLLESRPIFLLKSQWVPFATGLWILGLICDGMASTGKLAFSIPADALIGVGELCLFYQLLSFKLSWRSLNFLGDYSYGIFLTHMNFYVPIWMLMSRTISNYWLRFVVVTLLTCGLGYLFEWGYRRLQQKGTA